MGVPALDLFAATTAPDGTPPSLTVVRVRSKLCPPECPVDYSDVNASGGTLLRVVGPPQFPRWLAEYSVTIDERVCPFCEKPTRGGTRDNGLAFLPADAVKTAPKPADQSIAWGGAVSRWAHHDCVAFASPKKVTAMATFLVTHDLPDCAVCGQPYAAHGSDLMTIWDAWCDYECTQFWRPVKPFGSQDWPFPVYLDSPRYAGVEPTADMLANRRAAA